MASTAAAVANTTSTVPISIVLPDGKLETSVLGSTVGTPLRAVLQAARAAGSAVNLGTAWPGTADDVFRYQPILIDNTINRKDSSSNDDAKNDLAESIQLFLLRNQYCQSDVKIFVVPDGQGRALFFQDTITSQQQVLPHCRLVNFLQTELDMSHVARGVTLHCRRGIEMIHYQHCAGQKSIKLVLAWGFADKYRTNCVLLEELPTIASIKNALQINASFCVVFSSGKTRLRESDPLTDGSFLLHDLGLEGPVVTVERLDMSFTIYVKQEVYHKKRGRTELKHPLQVRYDDRIYDVKQKYTALEGTPERKQLLYFNGRYLIDDHILADCGILSESTLDMQKAARKTAPTSSGCFSEWKTEVKLSLLSTQKSFLEFRVDQTTSCADMQAKAKKLLRSVATKTDDSLAMRVAAGPDRSGGNVTRHAIVVEILQTLQELDRTVAAKKEEIANVSMQYATYTTDASQQTGISETLKQLGTDLATLMKQRDELASRKAILAKEAGSNLRDCTSVKLQLGGALRSTQEAIAQLSNKCYGGTSTGSSNASAKLKDLLENLRGQLLNMTKVKEELEKEQKGLSELVKLFDE
eukprot:scaffold451_cov184-Amphora_coffeaeformis.AAC.10